MSKATDQFDGSDCVCSFGMKLTWDINDPKLPQVSFATIVDTLTRATRNYVHAFLSETAE